MFTPAKTEVVRSDLFFCHSVCVQPHAKCYAWIYMNFFLPKLGFGPISSDFILEVIRIDLHCHLEVTVAQSNGRLWRRNGKRYGQSYYRTLIGSRMCSVQWRYPRWPWSTFQSQTRTRCVLPPPVKNLSVRFCPWRRFALSECSQVCFCSSLCMIIVVQRVWLVGVKVLISV